MTHTHFDPIATTLALAASVCRHVQARLDSLRSITKDDASPVTIADFASQAVVARGLVGSGLLAGGLVAEESADFLKHPDHRAHLHACLDALRESGAWSDCGETDLIDAVDLGATEAACLTSDEGGWTLDPIDGTKGFLRGQQYCVSLAFIRKGRVQRGYLACPNLPLDPDTDPATDSPASVAALGTLFWASDAPAESGEGATRVCALADFHQEQEARGAGGVGGVDARGRSPISPTVFPAARADDAHLADAPRTVRLAESVESGHSNHSASATVIDHAAAALGARVLPSVRLDSQCKYAVVARGQADVYLRLPSRKGYVERIWDHAAGMLIARQAGCVVTDALGRELDFSRGRGLEANRGIVAAPAWLHPQLIRSIDNLAPRDALPAR